MLTQDQLQTLRTFLDANAATYAALTDQEAAETLNALTETRVKDSLTGAEVFSVTDGAELNGLTEGNRAAWLSLCAVSEMDPSNGSPAHALATDLFPASTTLSNLQTLRQETVSPAATQNLPLIRAEYVRLARLLP